MVAVYKTDVTEEQKAAWIISILSEKQPDCQCNFDLEDQDHILRIKGSLEQYPVAEELLMQSGFSCIALE